MMNDEAFSISSRQIKPKIVFEELLNFLVKNKIEIPSYYTIAFTITNVINSYEDYLLNLIDKNIKEDQKKLLNQLLESKQIKNTVENEIYPYYYKLTQLKKVNQSLRPMKIKNSVSNFKYLNDIFNKLYDLIKILDLSPDIISYYANAVLKSDIRNIARRKKNNQYLHLIAFVVHSFYRHHDTLVDILLRSVQNYINKAKKEYKSKQFDDRKEIIKNTKELINSVSVPINIVSEIKNVINSDKLSNKDKIEKIKEILTKDNTTKIKKEQFKRLKANVKDSLKDKEYYDILEISSRKLQNRVSSIVLNAVFSVNTSDKNLIDAISNFKNNEKLIAKDLPMNF